MTQDTIQKQLGKIENMVQKGREREIETANLLQRIHENLGSIRNTKTLGEAKSIAFVTQLHMTSLLHAQMDEMEKETTNDGNR